MVTYTCDGCGREMPRHALRYSVTIEARAAYDEMEIGLAELVRDHRQEMLDLIERLKHKAPKEIEETVYKSIHLDLCPKCHQAFIRDPLHFHPEQAPVESDIDIDEFLRSLGYGKPKEGGGA